MSARRTLMERLEQLRFDLRYGWDPESSPRSDADTVLKIGVGIAILGLALLFAWCQSVGIRVPHF